MRVFYSRYTRSFGFSRLTLIVPGLPTAIIGWTRVILIWATISPLFRLTTRKVSLTFTPSALPLFITTKLNWTSVLPISVKWSGLTRGLGPLGVPIRGGDSPNSLFRFKIWFEAEVSWVVLAVNLSARVLLANSNSCRLIISATLFLSICCCNWAACASACWIVTSSFFWMANSIRIL